MSDTKQGNTIVPLYSQGVPSPVGKVEVSHEGKAWGSVLMCQRGQEGVWAALLLLQ